MLPIAQEVLSRLDDGAHLLDVGVGTGSALLKNASLVASKRLAVTGVDYDLHYVERALEQLVGPAFANTKIVHESIYDFKGGPFDAAYFSSSLMLMPDPIKARGGGGGAGGAGGGVRWAVVVVVGWLRLLMMLLL